jgi:hypothetical protein
MPTDASHPIPLPKTSAPAQRALNGAGVYHVGDLTRFTEAEIAALHGMGPKALGILKQALAGAGLAFREATDAK